MQDKSKAKYRIWRASPEAVAGVCITPTEALLIGNKNNFYAANDIGVLMQGNSIVLNCLSENIRNGGLFVKMNDFTQMIPQTLVTPVPNQIPFPPIAFSLKTVKDLPIFIAALV